MIGDRRELGGPDAGVSVVVGAVLLIGAVVSGLVAYRLTVVPQMAEQAEADHLEAAGAAMTGLNERVLANLDDLSSARLPTSIPLQPRSPSVVSVPLGGGAVSFDPRQSSVTLSSPVLRIQTLNGTTQIGGAGASGQWQAISGSDTIPDVTAVHGLRINITEPDPAAGDRVRITITDANGNYAGEYSTLFQVNPPVLALLAETRDPSATSIFHNHLVEMRQASWDSNYFVNGLDPLYSFDQILESAEKPMTLTFSEEGANAAFIVAYEKAVGNGLSVLQGAGRDVPGYEKTLQTGPIRFTSQNNWFLDQTYTIEHGAVILEQSDGAVFRVDPPFEARASSSFVRVGYDVPMFSGEPVSIAGTESAQLFTRTESSTTVGAIAGRLNVSVQTSYPSLWAGFFEAELTDAGLTSQNCPPASPSSGCQFQVTTTADTARLEIYGPTATDADPLKPTHDIAIDHLRGRVPLEAQR